MTSVLQVSHRQPAATGRIFQTTSADRFEAAVRCNPLFGPPATVKQPHGASRLASRYLAVFLFPMASSP